MGLIRNICRILNAQFHWSPGVSEHLSYGEICKYWSVFNGLLDLNWNKDYRKFLDENVLTDDMIADRSDEVLRAFMNGQEFINKYGNFNKFR